MMNLKNGGSMKSVIGAIATFFIYVIVWGGCLLLLLKLMATIANECDKIVATLSRGEKNDSQSREKD